MQRLFWCNDQQWWNEMHFLVISSGYIFHSGPACPNQPFYAKVHPGICQSDNWRTKNAPFPHHPLSLHWLIGWRNDDFYLAIKSLYYQHKVGLIPSSQNIHIVSSFFRKIKYCWKTVLSKREQKGKETQAHLIFPNANSATSLLTFCQRKQNTKAPSLIVYFFSTLLIFKWLAADIFSGKK